MRVVQVGCGLWHHFHHFLLEEELMMLRHLNRNIVKLFAIAVTRVL